MSRLAPVVLAAVVACACRSPRPDTPHAKLTLPAMPLLAVRADGAVAAVTNDRVARLTRDGRLVAAVTVAIPGTIEDTVVDARGEVVVVGQQEGAGCYMQSLRPTGQPRWDRRFPTTGTQLCRALAMDAAGDLYMASYGGPTEQSLAITVRRLDGATGALRWEKTFGGGVALARDLAIAGDGTVLVGGHFAGELRIGETTLRSVGDHDALLFALAPDGAVKWARSFGDVGFDLVKSIAIADGDAYVVGAWMRPQEFQAGEDPFHAGIMDGMIAKHAIADGALAWRRILTRGDGSQVHDVAVAGERVVVIGHFQREVALGARILVGREGHAAYVAELTAEGGVANARVISPVAKLGQQVVVTSDGQVLAGQTDRGDAFVVWEPR